MKVLITGGTGFIGKHLTQHFLTQKNQVIILTRKPTSSNQEGLSYITYENGKIPTIDNVDVLINLAGAGIADKNWTKSYKNEILESRIKATRACVDFIHQSENKPKVFVSSSAIGYYGTKSSKILDEHSSPGDDFLADVAVKWEAEALKANIRTVLLRTGIVLGMDGGALPKIIPPFKFYAGNYIGNGKQGFPWIHIADVVNLIDWAIHHENVSGPLNLVAPETMNNAQFSKILGKVLHKPSGLPLPAMLIKSLLGERAMLLLEGQLVYPKKAIEMGYQFIYPTAETALKNLLVK
jgi:uncharacterized protein (TIGR01777 family)